MPTPPIQNNTIPAVTANHDSVLPRPAVNPAVTGGTISQMNAPAARLYLPNLRNRAINMPLLVQQLNDLLQEQSSESHIKPEYIAIDEKEMVKAFHQIRQNQSRFNSEFKYIEFYLAQVLKDFLKHLQDHQPPLPEALYLEAKKMLNAKSQFFTYMQSNQIVPYLTEKDFPILLKIINQIKAIAHDLHEAPAEVIEQALLHFPPRKNEDIDELKCLDGILDRLETSSIDIKQHLRRLGLIPNSLLIHKINPQLQDPMQRINNIMLKACHQTKLDSTIASGQSVHLIKALFLSLGIAPNIYDKNNRFAETVLNGTPGHLLFATQQAFAKALQQSFNQDFQEPETQQNLQRHQHLLNSITQQHLNEDTFHHRLTADGVPDNEIKAYKDPLSYGLKLVKKMPIIDYLQEKKTSDLQFEQEFGLWNDFATALEDWDWQALNQKLEQHLLQESALTASPSPHSDLSIADIYEKTQTKTTSAAVFGRTNPNEQWFALNLILGQLNANSSRLQPTEGTKQWCFVRLMGSFDLNQTPSGRLFSDYIREAIQHHLRNHPTIPMANKNLMLKLADQVKQHYSTTFPYSVASIRTINSAMVKLVRNFPLSLLDLTILINYNKINEIASSQFEQYLQKKLAHSQLLTELKPALRALQQSHNRHIYNHLNMIFSQHQDLLHNLLIPEIAVLFDQQGLLSDNKKIIELFENPNHLLSWFPAILTSPALHENRPQLTYAMVRYAMLQDHVNLLSDLIHIPTVLNNILHGNIEGNTSLVTLNLMLPSSQMAIIRTAIIGMLDWPAKHYLGPAGTLSGSEYFKIITETKNIQGFTQAYNHMNKENVRFSRKIIADYIMLQFLTAKSKADLNFFIQLCQSLPSSDRNLLGDYRSQLIQYALNSESDLEEEYFDALMQALPSQALKSIADFLFIHANHHQRRNDPNTKANERLSEMGVDVVRLIQKYPVMDHFDKAKSYADTFYSVALLEDVPEDQLKFAPLLRSGTPTHLYILGLIEADPEAFLNSLQIDKLGLLCNSQHEQMLEIFTRLYSVVPEPLRQRIRQEVTKMPDTLYSKIPVDIMSILKDT